MLRECWAKSLGGCRGGISGEHLVSESLWSDQEIAVKGLPWCRERYRFISVSNHTANILCRQHNSDLSPIDTAGATAFDAFRTAKRIHDERTEMSRLGVFAGRFDEICYEIDGKQLEQWLLKTLINFEMVGGQQLSVGPATTVGSPVDHELVEIAFGRREFAGRAGLYAAVYRDESVDLMERVQYTSWIRDLTHGSYIGAGAFGFFGFRFWLCMEPEGWPGALNIKHREMLLLHRVENIELQLNQRPSQKIVLSW